MITCPNKSKLIYPRILWEKLSMTGLKMKNSEIDSVTLAKFIFNTSSARTWVGSQVTVVSYKYMYIYRHVWIAIYRNASLVWEHPPPLSPASGNAVTVIQQLGMPATGAAVKI